MDNGLPISNPTYNIFNPVGLKYHICLQLELIHLTEHRYNHNFQDCNNPLCRCSLEPESNSHFFLCCHHYTVLHTDLMNGLKKKLWKYCDTFWKFPCKIATFWWSKILPFRQLPFGPNWKIVNIITMKN